MNIFAIEKKWWALIGISICSFIAFIDFTIINTALPAIEKNLTLTILQLQWVMNAFLLFYCLFLVTMGRVGDIWGRRRLLYIGVMLFTVASLFAGFAHSPYWLIICRAAQGIGEAIIIPCSLALIAATFSAQERGYAIGIWSSLGGLGLVAGPTLGGLIISLLDWRWIFFIVIPIAAIGLFICLFSVTESKDQTNGTKIDWLGFIFLGLSIASLIIALMQGSEWGWSSSLILSLFSITLITFIIFYVVEQHVSSPIVQFHLFVNHTFFACSVAQFAFVFFNCAALFLIPLYLQDIRNEVPYVLGLMLAPIPAMVALFSAMAGKFADKIGAKVLMVTGMLLFACSALLQIFFTMDSPVILILCAFLLNGLGWTLVMGPSAAAAISSVQENFAGVATGVLWTIQVLGGALGLALGGLIFRYQDKLSLLRSLNDAKIVLSSPQQQLVRSLLADPENAKQVLTRFTLHTSEEILPLFKQAFMRGYSSAMWLLFIVSLMATLLIFFTMKGKIVSSNQMKGQ